jgi:hypothetical protein
MIESCLTQQAACSEGEGWAELAEKLLRDMQGQLIKEVFRDFPAFPSECDPRPCTSSNSYQHPFGGEQKRVSLQVYMSWNGFQNGEEQSSCAADLD